MKEAWTNALAPWTKCGPDGWTVKRLKYAVRLMRDKVEPEASGLRYIGLEHVESWTGRLIEATAGEDGPDGLSTRFKPDDVLFGKLRPYLAKVHRAKQDGICSGELLVLRPTLLDSRYLNYFLLMSEFIGAVDASTYGSKMPRANWEFIGNLPVLVPSLDEQRAIADFLDYETARLDDLIGLQEKLGAALAERENSIVSSVVCRGLDGEVRLKSSKLRWVERVPEHWKIKRLKYAAKRESGHTPSKTVPEYWENCDIPWISLNEVGYLAEHDYIYEPRNKINALGLANSSARMLPTNTVVLSRDATVGRCGIIGRPMATSQHFINYICGPELLPEYLLFLFRYPMQDELMCLTMGSTLRTIGLPDVDSFTIPLPPLDEQRAIVEHVKKERDKMRAGMALTQRGIGLLQDYRSALISAAVTGQIDVRNYRPQEAAALCQ